MKAVLTLDRDELEADSGRSSKGVFHQFLDDTAYACAIVDADGQILMVNEGMRDLTGFSETVLFGRSIIDGFSGVSTHTKTLELIRNKLATRLPSGYRQLKYGADGAGYIVGGYILPFVDEETGDAYACVLERQLTTWCEQVFDDADFQQEVLRLLDALVIG